MRNRFLVRMEKTKAERSKYYVQQAKTKYISVITHLGIKVAYK